MDILSLRFGLATNSSSAHSLIFLPDGVKANDYPGYPHDPEYGRLEGFGDFGTQHFTAATPEQKLRYLAVMLRDRFRDQLPPNIADTLIKSWLGEFPMDDDDNIDHQSFIFIPSEHGTKLPSERFTKDLRDFFLKENLAILGGSDEVQVPHPLNDGSDFKLPMPGDTNIHWSNHICRYDETHKFWTIFCVKDGTKIRMRFDREPGEFSVRPVKSSVPELVDLKITNFCPHKCPFCVPPETEVLTPFGPKRIDEIQVGDKVYSFNEKIRQEDTVEQCHQRNYDGDLVTLELEDGSTLSLTPKHEVFTERGWIFADEIKEGDEVLQF